MSVECPADIFKQLEDGCGGDVCLGWEEGYTFLSDVFGEAEFLGVIKLNIGGLDDKSFNDWTYFEYWCDDIERDLMWQLVDEESCESSTPKDYFKSKAAIEEQIISVLCDSSREKPGSLLCREIESKNKKLFLIYEGLDGWALGHYNSVLVLKSLEELTPENGFYPQT